MKMDERREQEEEEVSSTNFIISSVEQRVNGFDEVVDVICLL